MTTRIMGPVQVNALILAPLYSFHHLVADQAHPVERSHGQHHQHDLPDVPFVDTPRTRCDGDISMKPAASNTVHIHAAHGRSEELGEYLANIVENLKSLHGCVASTLRRDENDQSLWIINVHWHSCEAMASHFAKPDNEGLNGLLSNRFVRHVAFESDPQL